MSDIKRNYRWVVVARFAGKTKEMLNIPRYHEFKRRLIMSIDSCRERDFDDKTMSFSHVCQKPSDLFEYYYALNPMPGDDILDDATVEIYRRENPAVKVANKTGRIMEKETTKDK